MQDDQAQMMLITFPNKDKYGQTNPSKATAKVLRPKLKMEYTISLCNHDEQTKQDSGQLGRTRARAAERS